MFLNSMKLLSNFVLLMQNKARKFHPLASNICFYYYLFIFFTIQFSFLSFNKGEKLYIKLLRDVKVQKILKQVFKKIQKCRLSFFFFIQSQYSTKKSKTISFQRQISQTIQLNALSRRYAMMIKSKIYSLLKYPGYHIILCYSKIKYSPAIQSLRLSRLCAFKISVFSLFPLLFTTEEFRRIQLTDCPNNVMAMVRRVLNEHKTF